MNSCKELTEPAPFNREMYEHHSNEVLENYPQANWTMSRLGFVVMKNFIKQEKKHKSAQKSIG